MNTLSAERRAVPLTSGQFGAVGLEKSASSMQITHAARMLLWRICRIRRPSPQTVRGGRDPPPRPPAPQEVQRHLVKIHGQDGRSAVAAAFRHRSDSFLDRVQQLPLDHP